MEIGNLTNLCGWVDLLWNTLLHSSSSSYTTHSLHTLLLQQLLSIKVIHAYTTVQSVTLTLTTHLLHTETTAKQLQTVQ